MNAPLRPCPFCSAEPVVSEVDEDLWAVGCAECGALGPHPQGTQDVATAIRRWNDFLAVLKATRGRARRVRDAVAQTIRKARTLRLAAEISRLTKFRPPSSTP